MTILSLRDINYRCKKSQVQVLRGLDLDLAEGEVLGLVGRSSSGKSTLLKVMRGFIPHYIQGDFSGEVAFRGKNLTDHDLGGLTRQIGYVFENSFIYETSGLDTVYDELEFPLDNLGLKENMKIVRVDQVLKRLGIYDLRYKNPKDLSPGERQLVSLASVVAMDPDLLILDDPTSALDGRRSRLVLDLIQDLKDQGKTIVLASRSLEIMGGLADRIAVLDEGRLVLEGPSREILMDASISQYGVYPPAHINLYKSLVAEGVDLGRLPLSLDQLEQDLKIKVKR